MSFIAITVAQFLPLNYLSVIVHIVLEALLYDFAVFIQFQGTLLQDLNLNLIIFELQLLFSLYI